MKILGIFISALAGPPSYTLKKRALRCTGSSRFCNLVGRLTHGDWDKMEEIKKEILCEEKQEWYASY